MRILMTLFRYDNISFCILALHAVDLPYVDRQTCSIRWQQYAVSITELQICAGELEFCMRCLIAPYYLQCMK